MAKIQAYVSDEVTNKINAIVEARRLEGAKERDVSFSSISTMLLELGLRVYEAQMERKESAFNQMEFNKVLLESVLKTKRAVDKVMSMESLSPHVQGDPRWVYKNMTQDILQDVNPIIERFFPIEHDDE
ncbi:relaxosome protein TraM (plasmid) [Edwardsiella tarda]|uniref:conjugal transfer relaxosome DNA-binding protein TraM n=1 Tax=Edwardsiella tarda TaxID=636 RepID=UPI0024443040|nr:conjugal transfer relaxosome DNA-binding protein TraM [Edwardsiella tarda]WGE30928.1 relaxosome protein TraM [Edwardsiella tarda]WGE31038.1 relaxosome protein TraM [Edwardsiella tarda]